MGYGEGGRQKHMDPSCCDHSSSCFSIFSLPFSPFSLLSSLSLSQHGELEVMYHVGPMLPGGEGKEQELGRKRHLGNDVVLIVYQVLCVCVYAHRLSCVVVAAVCMC